MRKYIPIGNRVIIKKLNQDKKSNIILISEEKKESIVVAVGEGKFDNQGRLIPMRVKVGDHIITPPHGGLPITLENEECYLYTEDEIPCILRDE